MSAIRKGTVAGMGVIVLAAILVTVLLFPSSAEAVLLNPGDLDPSFGNGGLVSTSLGSDPSIDVISDMKLQPDGKIVVAGSSDDHIALARYNTDGALDSTFGAAGAITTTIGGYDGYAAALAIQADGKIVVAATNVITEAFPPSVFAYFELVVVRYNTDGSLDQSFGLDGEVTTPLPDTDHRQATLASDVILQQDGKIMVAAYQFGGLHIITNHYALLRYNSNGSLDATFGSGGKVLGPDAGSDGYENFQSIAIQADGKIVAGGASGSPSITSNFFLARFNSNGSLDTSFDGDGRVITKFEPDFRHDSIGSIKIRLSGEIIAVGRALAGSGALAQYNPDGSLDASFSDDGLLLLSGDNKFISEVEIDAAGKLVVAGASDNDFFLERFNQDGTPDQTFGVGGQMFTQFADAAYSAGASAAEFMADGRIVAAGSLRKTQEGNDMDFALARYAGSPINVTLPTPTIGPGCLFSDVCESDFFFTPVTYLADAGVLSGYGDNTFRPFNSTTRGQITKIIVLAEGWQIDTTGGPHFSDVTPANTFYSYAETAFKHGVISGYADGTFGWANPVTRGQLALIIVRAQGWKVDTAGGPHFSDVLPSNPFYGAIETSYKHGIISGYADGMFRWGAATTRGQVAKIVYLATTGGVPPTSGTRTAIPPITATGTAIASATSTVATTATASPTPTVVTSLK